MDIVWYIQVSIESLLIFDKMCKTEKKAWMAGSNRSYPGSLLAAVTVQRPDNKSTTADDVRRINSILSLGYQHVKLN